MKHIRKGNEPEEFMQWKQAIGDLENLVWNDLGGKPKIALHNALQREQGYICCYCGRRIGTNQVGNYTSHIEHLQPRNAYPMEVFNYANLLASCPGFPEADDDKLLTKQQPAQNHCGQRKSDWYDPQLMVSPLMSNCADFFKYPASGEILPTDNPSLRTAAAETISRVGLDDSKLEASRRAAIIAIEQLVLNQTGSLTRVQAKARISALIRGFEQPNEQGKLLPFCAAIFYMLRQYDTPN